MKHQLETITPQIAKSYLETNINNRPLDDHYASRLADVMKSGLWKINGEVIRFDTLGRLFDGQHRLQAVIKSGVTIQTFVLRGLDSESVHTVDGDRKLRSISDVFHFEGQTNCREFARMVRKIWRIKALCAGTPSKRFITNSQAVDFLKVNERGLLNALNTVSKSPGIMTREILAAWLFLFGQTEKAVAFIIGLQSGRNLNDDSPILLLRDYLIADNNASKKLPIDTREAMTIKAWNAFALGEVPKLLRYQKSEKFPTIYIA
jgi:hypothetical protein